MKTINAMGKQMKQKVPKTKNKPANTRERAEHKAPKMNNTNGITKITPAIFIVL